MIGGFQPQAVTRSSAQGVAAESRAEARGGEADRRGALGAASLGDEEAGDEGGGHGQHGHEGGGGTADRGGDHGHLTTALAGRFPGLRRWDA
jgi:hypothetical protein